MIRRTRPGLAMLIVAVFAAIIGCKSTPSAPPSKPGHADHPDEGPHGGPVAGFDHGGKGHGHAEVTIGADGTEIVVYFLDEEAKKPIEVSVDKISGVKVKFSKPKESDWIELKHDAAKSGDKGHAFVGKLESKIDKPNNDDLAGKITVKIDAVEFENVEFPEKH